MIGWRNKKNSPPLPSHAQSRLVRQLCWVLHGPRTNNWPVKQKLYLVLLLNCCLARLVFGNNWFVSFVSFLRYLKASDVPKYWNSILLLQRSGRLFSQVYSVFYNSSGQTEVRVCYTLRVGVTRALWDWIRNSWRGRINANRKHTVICVTCIAHWKHTIICVTCIAHWKHTVNCITCISHWKHTVICVTCIAHWKHTVHCVTCIAHWKHTANCVTCIAHWG